MIPKRDWDNVIKPVLLDALEALETVTWSEISQYSNKRDAQMRIKAKRNIRKLIAEMEDKEEEEMMSSISVDELKKMVLKLDLLLDRMMSVSINSDYAARIFTEHDCRALLRDIFNTWCEVNKEHEPMLKTIRELEYEDIGIRGYGYKK